MRTKQEFMKELLMPPADERGGMVPKAPVSVPVVSPFADWDYYFLQAPISWTPEAVYEAGYQPVTVPRGFVTDFASIPRPFWSIMPPASTYTHAAIIHDYLYWMQTGPRATADRIFDYGMRELSVPGWKRAIVAKAVRTFGGGAWNNNAKLKQSGERRILMTFPAEPTITWEQWKKQPGVFAH